MTPVHIAVIHGNVSLLRCLLEAQGNPNIQSKLGTAMDLATEHKHTNIQQFLKDFANFKRKRTGSNMRNSAYVPRPQTQPLEIERSSSESVLSNQPRTNLLSGSNDHLYTLHTPPTETSFGKISRQGSISTLSAAVDRKRQSFGISDESQRHLETYTCKLNKTHGVLYIYQRFIAFENMLNQKVKKI